MISCIYVCPTRVRASTTLSVQIKKVLAFEVWKSAYDYWAADSNFIRKPGRELGSMRGCHFQRRGM